MNQPNNPHEGGQPDIRWQSDQGQPIQPAGSTPNPASQEPYGAGQTPADNPGYQGEAGPYPSYQNGSGYQQQPLPTQPDPAQPAYRSQQATGIPQAGAAQPTYQPAPSQPTYQPTPTQPTYQPDPAQPAYQGQTYGQPAGYPQNTYQQPGYPQPGVGPQIPQTPAYPGGAGNVYTGEPPINTPWYGIDFVNACKRYFLKYATFSGRASRGEYWWPLLMEFLVYLVLSAFGFLLASLGPILTGLAMLVFIIPNIAVSVRRLHDSNLSGLWFLLLPGISFVGTLLLAGGIGASFSSALGSSMAFLPFFLVGGLINLCGFIAWVILMIRPSDPKGARFDRQS